jgi:hypothetical protein
VGVGIGVGSAALQATVSAVTAKKIQATRIGLNCDKTFIESVYEGNYWNAVNFMS